jgi:hypothetical protein
MNEINFEVGARYTNIKGEYVVLEVTNTSLKVRYVATGEVQELNREIQSRIITRLTTPPPPPPPVKPTRTTTSRSASKPKSTAKTTAKSETVTVKATPKTPTAPKPVTPAAPLPKPSATSQDPYQPLGASSGVYWLKEIDLNGATAPIQVNAERQALIFPGNGSAKSRPTIRRGDTLLYFSKGDNTIYLAAQAVTEPRQSDSNEPLGWKIYTYLLAEVAPQNAIKQENILLSNNERLYNALDQEGYISLTRLEGLRLLNELKAKSQNSELTSQEEE